MPDHEADHALGVELRGEPRRDRPTIFENADVVRQHLDFVEPVADVDDRRSPGGKLLQNPEQLTGIVRRERGGWLVQDHQPGVQPGCPRDLHHLLLGRRQLAHQPGNIDIDAELAQRLVCLPLHPRPGQGEGGPLLLPEEDVFRDRTVRQER